MLNQCIFMGNLTRKPELRHTPGGAAVCSFSIAVNRRYKGSDGNLHEEVTFIDCEAWNKTAELAAEYLDKGRAVIVETECRDDVWTDKETGNNRRKKKFTVNKMHFVPGGGNTSNETKKQQEEPAAAVAATADGGDDDIPF